MSKREIANIGMKPNHHIIPPLGSSRPGASDREKIEMIDSGQLQFLELAQLVRAVEVLLRLPRALLVGIAFPFDEIL